MAKFITDCDNFKARSLKDYKGNFEGKITLAEVCKEDLVWWVNNIQTAYKPLTYPEPSMILKSDDSKKEWGGVNALVSTGGVWSPSEAELHINILELKAAYLTIQTFCRDLSKCHIIIEMDNSTAVTYINNMGGGGGSFPAMLLHDSLPYSVITEIFTSQLAFYLE